MRVYILVFLSFYILYWMAWWQFDALNPPRLWELVGTLVGGALIVAGAIRLEHERKRRQQRQRQSTMEVW